MSTVAPSTIPVSVPEAAPVADRSRRRSRRLRHRLTVASFMAPATIGIAIFFLYPLVSAVYFSFTKFNLLSPPRWVGLENYRFMVEDANLLAAVKNTLWFIVVLVPARIVGALITGTLLANLKRASSLYRTIFYLPSLVPPVAATISFVYLFKPDTGPVNALLGRIGIEGPLWFNSPVWAKPSLVLLSLWGIGDLTVIFLAALLDVPVEQHEAAQLDGAGPWQRFRAITLPTISPVIVFAAITGVIATLQYFTQAAVAASVASNQATTGGGISSTFGYPEGSTFTYPLWLYVVGFRYNAMGYANALAVVLFIVAFSATLVMLRRTKAFTAGDMR
jgi:multiple sugar transport system permease protein